MRLKVWLKVTPGNGEEGNEMLLGEKGLVIWEVSPSQE